MFVRQMVLTGVAGLFFFTPFARSDEQDFFETEVRPVLAQHCYKCHGDKQQKGGIRLDGPKHLENPGDGVRPPGGCGQPRAESPDPGGADIPTTRRCRRPASFRTARSRPSSTG